MPEARVIPLHPHANNPLANNPRANNPLANNTVQRPRPARPTVIRGAVRPEWEQRVAGGLAFLRRRLTGDYEVDEFGFDRDLTEHVLLPPLRPLFEKWFRVETIGMHHVPAAGAGLVVANHSGTIPIDS